MAADEVVDTPFGKFLVNPADCIGATLKAGTLWDGPGFLQVIYREYYVPGTTVIDVGANLGGFTVWCAHEGARRIVAVEPVPLTLQYLKATLDLNKPTCADRVVLLPIAAYDQRITLGLPPIDPDGLGSPALWRPEAGQVVEDRLAVQAAPLDDYEWIFQPRVSLIKIDAQGCDGAALRGLQATIAIHHPTIVFEWEDLLAPPHGYTLTETISWLNRRHYDVHEWPSHPHNYLAVRRSD